MVNLELFNIVEDIKKVSKAFVVHPKNVNADNAASTNLPISSLLFAFRPSFSLLTTPCYFKFLTIKKKKKKK